MARKQIPVVVDEYLWVSAQSVNDEGQAIPVGSLAWYRWLADVQHVSFSFRHHDGTITARHERQRNGWYWYAYCKRAGQINKTYLGRPDELTIERLHKGAAVLAAKATVHRGKSRSENIASIHTSDSLILTEKFSVPTTNTQLITRSHLLKRLTRGAQNKLVLLSAAAGYGKTTLLSDWYAHSHRHDAKNACAWISLDTNDDDTFTFWTHVLIALKRVQPGIADEALLRLHNGQASTILGVLKTFINTCQTLTTDITLILDNYHVIQTPGIQQELTFLLDHLPTHFHLVIASREDPPLPLTRLRLQSSLTIVNNADLRFSPEETAQLLTKIAQPPLTTNECIPLTEYTEGWIAGIQLASMPVQHQYRYATTLNSDPSTNRDILAYFIEEVFMQQAPVIQQFLLQTAVLDRFNSSLCDAVREQDNSQLQLEKLEHLNLFLVPLDKQGQWYRYHHLFSQALRHHLNSSYPANVRDLHRRASLWYEAHDLLMSALQHADQAGDSATVARLQGQQSITQIQSYNQLDKQFVNWNIAEQTSTARTTVPAIRLLEPLTRREYDVLQQLLQGASNRDIAQCLIISEGTVKKHVSNICSKLGVQSRTQAVAKSMLLALC